MTELYADVKGPTANDLDATHLVTNVAEGKSLMLDVLRAANLSPSTWSPIAGLMASSAPAYTGLKGVDRHYHGPRHPARMWQTYLERSPVSGRPSFDTDVARFCVFHDIIYGVGAPGEAEQRSADEYVRFVRDYGLEANPVRLANVLNAIARSAQYATHHPYLNEVVETCLDLDLYELSTPRYWVNSILIRREMAHVDVEAFVWGRLAFLKSMLLRPKLYYQFVDCEDAARDNLAAEHDMLSAAGDAKRLPWADWPNNLPEAVRDLVPRRV